MAYLIDTTVTGTLNVTNIVNATSFVTSSGRYADNSVRVSANGGSTIAPANGINFVNTSSVTVSVTNGIDGNANVSFTSTGGGGGASSKSITILNPTATDNITMFYTTSALTISKCRTVLYNGTSTPNVRFSIISGSSRATETTTNINGEYANNTTTGVDHTTSTASISAGSWVWCKLISVTGTVPEFHVTLEF